MYSRILRDPRASGYVIHETADIEAVMNYVMEFYGCDSTVHFRYRFLRRILYPDHLRKLLLESKPWKATGLMKDESNLVRKRFRSEVDALVDFLCGRDLRVREQILTALLYAPKDYVAPEESDPPRSIEFVDLPHDVQRVIIERSCVGSRAAYLAETRFTSQSEPGQQRTWVTYQIDAARTRNYKAQGAAGLLPPSFDAEFDAQALKGGMFASSR